jgi:Mitochondrial carrier protein
MADGGGARGPSPPNTARLTIQSCAKLIYQKEGIAGFFNGAGPRLLIISPLFGITMFFYELFGEKASGKK